MYKYTWYCRWCGTPYEPIKQTDRDGFCHNSHKQAHYRAYKKWYTNGAHGRAVDINTTVTQKKRKKRK